MLKDLLIVPTVVLVYRKSDIVSSKLYAFVFFRGVDSIGRSFY